jgi:fumitremorgin C synthase
MSPGRWSEHKRLQMSVLNPQMSKKYRTLQDLESMQLVHALVSKPSTFSRQFHRYAASLSFGLAYGKS